MVRHIPKHVTHPDEYIATAVIRPPVLRWIAAGGTWLELAAALTPPTRKRIDTSYVQRMIGHRAQAASKPYNTRRFSESIKIERVLIIIDVIGLDPVDVGI